MLCGIYIKRCRMTRSHFKLQYTRIAIVKVGSGEWRYQHYTYYIMIHDKLHKCQNKCYNILKQDKKEKKGGGKWNIKIGVTSQQSDKNM